MHVCVYPGIHGCILMYCLYTFIGEKQTTKKLQDNDSGTESNDSHTISSGN